MENTIEILNKYFSCLEPIETELKHFQQLIGQKLIVNKYFEFTLNKNESICCGNIELHARYGCRKTCFYKGTSMLISDVVIESPAGHKFIRLCISSGCRKLNTSPYMLNIHIRRGELSFI